MNTKEKETEESNSVPNTTTNEAAAVTPLNNHLSTAPLNTSENAAPLNTSDNAAPLNTSENAAPLNTSENAAPLNTSASPTAQEVCDNKDTVGTERAKDSREILLSVVSVGSRETVTDPREISLSAVPAFPPPTAPPTRPSTPPPPTPPTPPTPSPPPTAEAACGPGESSTRMDSSPSDPQDQNFPMNRLSRVSRVLMPIQQLAEASTQMYPALFHPIGASGVIIYSDGSSTDVSGLTIPYFDPIRELTAGLMSVTDPAGEHFEWNSLLESDASHTSHAPGSMGEDYYIATYVDPEENSSVLFTSMDPVSEVPYTTLEVLDGVEIDSTRGIVISARPPPPLVPPAATQSEACALSPEVTPEREVAVSDPSSHPTTPVAAPVHDPADNQRRETPPAPHPPDDNTKAAAKPRPEGGCT